MFLSYHALCISKVYVISLSKLGIKKIGKWVEILLVLIIFYKMITDNDALFKF